MSQKFNLFDFSSAAFIPERETHFERVKNYSTKRSMIFLDANLPRGIFTLLPSYIPVFLLLSFYKPKQSLYFYGDNFAISFFLTSPKSIILFLPITKIQGLKAKGSAFVPFCISARILGDIWRQFPVENNKGDKIVNYA